MSSVTKAILLLIVSQRVYYGVSAAGCGLIMKESPDNPPGMADSTSTTMRKEKMPVDTANLPFGCDTGDAVDIELPNGKVKTFKRSPGLLSKGRGKSAMKPFHGESDDGSSLQYIRHDDNTIFGSLVDVTDHTVSQFRIDAFGKQVVDTIPSNEFPPEGDPMHDDERMLLEKSEDEPLSTMSDSTFIHSLRSSKSLPYSTSRDLLDDSGGNLDVLVVWTSKAECRNSGLSSGCSRTGITEANMRSRINLAITETNTAYDLSGVDTQLFLVHATHVGDYTEVSGNAFSQALNDITSTSDGIMDHVHTLRTHYGADIVAMIIDDPQYCGMAWLGPTKSRMFSVTAWNCATGYYSFGHEIGHNLGCNHDKGTSNACSNSNYNYGWRDPNANFRSILAYNCASGQCDNNAGGGCSRVQRFSNPNFLYNGSPMGSAQHDNARRINDVRAIVAAYYPHNTNPGTLSPTASPTIAPTKSSSPTASPTTSKSPTASPSASPSLECGAGEALLIIDIITDNYPAETSWKLTNTCTNTLVLSKGPYATVGPQQREIACVPRGNYEFEINDTYGDGICCDYGLGYYRILFDGTEVASGGAFASTEVKTFGDRCTASPSNAPSASPTSSISPTALPSLSPSFNPSSMPSISPSSSPSTVPTNSIVAVVQTFAKSDLVVTCPFNSTEVEESMSSDLIAALEEDGVTVDVAVTILSDVSCTGDAAAGRLLENLNVDALIESTVTIRDETKNFTSNELLDAATNTTSDKFAVTSVEVIEAPSAAPSESPSSRPTSLPSISPSDLPSVSPSFAPTEVPSPSPSKVPTEVPSPSPTKSPTESPSMRPTRLPSFSPTAYPTANPTPQSYRLCRTRNRNRKKNQCVRTSGCRWITGVHWTQRCQPITPAPTPMPSRSPTRSPSASPTSVLRTFAKAELVVTCPFNSTKVEESLSSSLTTDLQTNELSIDISVTILSAVSCTGDVAGRRLDSLNVEALIESSVAITGESSSYSPSLLVDAVTNAKGDTFTVTSTELIESPSAAPSASPSLSPTLKASASPTNVPTVSDAPSFGPTVNPTPQSYLLCRTAKRNKKRKLCVRTPGCQWRANPNWRLRCQPTN